MASIRGERFHIPLDDNGADEEYDAFEKHLATAQEESSSAEQAALPLSAFANLVGDIKERSTAPSTAAESAVLPKAPGAKSSVTGFPQPRKRVPVSRFKSQRQNPGGDDVVPEKNREKLASGTMSSEALSSEETTRREIDEENRAKLSRMSQSEIAQERSELMNSLSPSLVQRLLQRSTIDDTFTQNVDNYPTAQSGAQASNTSYNNGLSTANASAEKQSKKVAFDVTPQTNVGNVAGHDQIKDGTLDDKDLDDRPAPSSVIDNPPQMHFPKPVQPPELDPSHPEFFDSLHEKYFPSLPADPSKLAWMSASPDASMGYDPNAESIQASQIRFGFKGELLAPRTAQSIPVTKGLHHHGEAPESAGYTIRELAHLSRSSVPTQRCIAYQVLGRLMYRLGRGEYGDDELCKGLWRCVEEGRVLDTLQEEVDKKGGHMSAKAYATDALWLWQRGGGKRLGTG